MERARERERETRIHPVAKRFLTTFGTEKNRASSFDLHIFFPLLFLFRQCVAQTNGHHGSIPTREPLVFPRWRSRKTFQRPRETQTTILRTCISTDYAHNFSRKFLNFPSTSRNELEDGVIGNDEEIPLIPPFSKINETYPNIIAI